MKKSSVGDKALELLVPVNYLKTPYKRLSGRTTTIGRELVNYSFTYGAAGLIKDGTYMHAQRAAGKANDGKSSVSKKGK
jgi:hypothetical protein